MGGVAAYVDAEHALDIEYAKKLGVDVEDLLVSQPDTGEQALEIVEILVRSGAVDLVVIDSVAALVPKAEIEGEMGDSHVGLQARLMSQALRKLAGAINRSNSAVVFINQLREKIGVMFGNPETTTGGKALKFYASLRLDIRRIGPVKERETVIGNHVRVKVVKNKVAPPFRQAEFDIMFDEGISHTSLLVDLASEANIIQKSGAWYSYGDQRIGQGRENAKLFLRDNPALMTEVEGKVKELLGMQPGRRGRRGGHGRRVTARRITALEPDPRRAGTRPGRGGRARGSASVAPRGRWRRSGSGSGARARRGTARRASRAAADAEAAYRTALRALERRSFARADLGRRLRRKGHAPGRSTRRSSALAERGLLDDAAFAAQLRRDPRRARSGSAAPRAGPRCDGRRARRHRPRARRRTGPRAPMPPAMCRAPSPPSAPPSSAICPGTCASAGVCSPTWRAAGSAGETVTRHGGQGCSA